MKKRLKKIWQKFLVISFVVSIGGAFFWTFYLDGKSWFPVVMWLANIAWMVLITVSNDPERIEESKRKEKMNGVKSTKY